MKSISLVRTGCFQPPSPPSPLPHMGGAALLLKLGHSTVRELSVLSRCSMRGTHSHSGHPGSDVVTGLCVCEWSTCSCLEKVCIMQNIIYKCKAKLVIWRTPTLNPVTRPICKCLITYLIFSHRNFKALGKFLTICFSIIWFKALV